MNNFLGLSEGSLDAFLEFLYDGLTGYVIVGELQSNGSKTWMDHTSYSWPKDKSDLKSHLVFSSKERDVYITPAVFEAPSPTKEFFKASNVAWAEYDNPVDPETASTDDTAGASGLSSPSLRIQSSTGREHRYWRMIQPFENIEELETTNRALAYTTGADKGGWDAVQFLRPIRTYNYKYDTPFEVAVIEFNTNEFPRGVLDTGYTPEEIKKAEIQLPTELPPIADIILKYPFPLEVSDLYRKNNMPDGTRHQALMNLAYGCAEMGMSGSEIFAVLQHRDLTWKKFSDRSDKNQRYLDIVRIAKGKYPNAKDVYEQEDRPPGSDLLVLGWKSLRDFKVEYDWIVEGMFMQNTMNIMAGKPGVGKTQISLRFAENLALGKAEFLGFKIPKQRRVLMMSLELNIVGVQIFQESINKSLTSEEMDALEDSLMIAPLGNPMDLTGAYGQDSLDYLIEKHKPDVVMIDSMGSVVPGGLSKEEPVSRFLQYNDKLNSNGTSTWLISHPRKTEVGQSSNKPPTMDDLFGNVYQAARARGIYALHDTMKDGKLALLTLKQSFAKDDKKKKYIARDDHLNFSITEAPSTKTTFEKKDEEPKVKKTGNSMLDSL